MGMRQHAGSGYTSPSLYPLASPESWEGRKPFPSQAQYQPQPAYAYNLRYAAQSPYSIPTQHPPPVQYPARPHEPEQLVQPPYRSPPPPPPVQPLYEEWAPSQPKPRSRSRSRSRIRARRRRIGEPPLYFYHRDENYYEFANVAPFPVWYGGVQYPTSEHLFHAHRFLETNPGLAERVRLQPTPQEALQEAERNLHASRKGWDEVKVPIMERVLEAKFTQHPKLRKLLLSTGDRDLFQYNPDDWFWGSGADRKGRNEFGRCLMRVRDKFRESDAR